MAANVSNIDVILKHDVINVPECPHGPTLLFERYGKGDETVKRFFACSAFRDRKECPFFQWEGEKVSEAKMHLREKHNQVQQLPFSHEECYNRLKKLKELPVDQLSFCKKCGLLLFPEETSNHEVKGHDIQFSVTSKMLNHPTELFSPLDNNKTFAQYLFSKSAVDFLIKTLSDADITHVLCVGTPRLHEAIQNLSDDGTRSLSSLLLDLDHRYMQVYHDVVFCQYNMFNHHFFGGEKSKSVFHQFVKEEKGKTVAMVMDPPFGGMVEALAATMDKIVHTWKTLSNKSDGTQLPVFWIFPYFMENRITQCVQKFSMLDYKVAYDNHALFTGGPMSKKKKRSPVRIFTNLPPDSVVLPLDQGYWFCQKCSRYSAPENKHCELCGVCPSKDGTTYVHCDKCGRCVKPSRFHCDSCGTCQQQDHRCGVSRPAGCHVCGSLEHKRRQCPRKLNLSSAEKSGRSIEDEDAPPKKRKKKRARKKRNQER
ncbi:hypothetical protein ScPMuIL_018935 [Solemya velum]